MNDQEQDRFVGERGWQRQASRPGKLAAGGSWCWGAEWELLFTHQYRHWAEHPLDGLRQPQANPVHPSPQPATTIRIVLTHEVPPSPHALPSRIMPQHPRGPQDGGCRDLVRMHRCCKGLECCCAAPALAPATLLSSRRCEMALCMSRSWSQLPFLAAAASTHQAEVVHLLGWQ